MKKIVILSDRMDRDNECVLLLQKLFEECEICIVSSGGEITHYEPAPRLLANPESSKSEHLAA